MNNKIFFIEHLSKIIRSWRIFVLHAKGYKNISRNSVIERRVELDKIKPSGIHIGDGCLIASGSTILCHEHIYRDEEDPRIPYTTDTYIGRRCFIGVRALILPGVKIGDDCVIGAGCIVNKDIPSGCMAVGVPAKIVKTGLKLNERAVLVKKNS